MKTKKKGKRIQITLECLTCRINTSNKGVARYLTTKNRQTTTNLLTLSKYCSFCKQHILFTEIR